MFECVLFHLSSCWVSLHFTKYKLSTGTLKKLKSKMLPDLKLSEHHWKFPHMKLYFMYKIIFKLYKNYLQAMCITIYMKDEWILCSDLGPISKAPHYVHRILQNLEVDRKSKTLLVPSIWISETPPATPAPGDVHMNASKAQLPLRSPEAGDVWPPQPTLHHNDRCWGSSPGLFHPSSSNFHPVLWILRTTCSYSPSQVHFSFPLLARPPAGLLHTPPGLQACPGKPRLRPCTPTSSLPAWCCPFTLHMMHP